SHNIHFLNELSTIIWELYVTESLSIKEISKEISSAFNVSFDVAHQDVESTIKYWISIFSDTPYAEKKEPDKIMPVLDSTISYQHHIYIQLPSLLIKVNSNDTPSLQQIEIIFNHLIIKDITPLVDYEIYIIKSEEEFLICLNDRVLEIAQSSSHIPVMLHRAVTELACNHNEWIAILHAGGICYEDQAILFPSVGGSGKSTLTSALVKSGFAYLNDDVLPLLKNRLITPIPVNMCIKSGSWAVLQKWYPEINDLEVYGRNNLQVKYLKPPSYDFKASAIHSRFLITPKYKPQHENVALQKISTVEALSAIIEADSLIKKPLSKNNIKALVSWIEGIECYSLEYSNLDLAIEAIKNLVEASEV
ncbi:MAG: hypothetical protein V7749_17540, partial [Cocleimonas sp.]